MHSVTLFFFPPVFFRSVLCEHFIMHLRKKENKKILQFAILVVREELLVQLTFSFVRSPYPSLDLVGFPIHEYTYIPKSEERETNRLLSSFVVFQ